MGKLQRLEKAVINGIGIEQRLKDGFINGTAMCQAQGELIADWFRTEQTLELFSELAAQEGIKPVYGKSHKLDRARLSATKYVKMFPGLIISKTGGFDVGGGTWLHPKLAISLAQWCSPAFALQVSTWVMEWMSTGGETNPLSTPQAIDGQRVDLRLDLKDEARINLMQAVTNYYKNQEFDDGKIYWLKAEIHDEINVLITTETSAQMKERLGDILGREIKQWELIRDYFPAKELNLYIGLCTASAHFIRQGTHPQIALDKAAEIVLSVWRPRPINFACHINRFSKFSIEQKSSIVDK